MPTIDVIEEVRNTLDLDPRIPHPAEIAVAEKFGTVTLRGTVGSIRQRHAAAEIAESIEGVGFVDNELRVDPLEDVEDDQIRGAALQTLIWDPDVPADDIDVSVVDRWLTLRGTVAHQYESEAAFEDMFPLPGLAGITNELKVIAAVVPQS